MGKKYIEDNIERLRKERDDKVIGGYRDLVVKVYQYIDNKIKKSKNDYCNPSNSEISNSVFGNKNQEAKIRSFMKDLKKSGYISVYDVGLSREVKILKPLDF